MIDRRQGLRIILGSGVAVGLAACGGSGGTVPGTSDGTVLSVARDNGLNRFLRAIDAAGLTDTLAGGGPYTVFAPTDRAFAAADLPRDTGALRDVMAFHIVPGMFTSDFLTGVDVNYTTLKGTSVNVDGTSGLRVGDATVVTPDLGASNGVVNIIDRVLTPR